MTTEEFDNLDYRRIRVARDKYVYTVDGGYDPFVEHAIIKAETTTKRMGVLGKVVRVSKTTKAVHNFLQAVGIHGEKIYYGEMAKELTKYFYTDSICHLSDVTVKRLLRSEYTFALRDGQCFFYGKDLDRLDTKFEHLLKTLAERQLCPY